MEIFLLSYHKCDGDCNNVGKRIAVAVPIRTPLRSVLMSRCRAIHPVRNLAACEQAPNSQFRPVCAPLVEPRKVKEHVGVDMLFWRRYFVTYGV